MILKTYIVEKNINILEQYKAVLLYGVNDGIKDDIKNTIKKNNKDAEIINFFETEIIKSRNILYENIVNESLFNEKKIIFIQSATDKIVDEILDGLEKNNQYSKIYIFSENLEKKSKLRNLFEKNKELAILPCYEDNERTLINYIDQEFKTFKGLTGELINLIISNSNSKRKIIQSEIIKIKDFFLEKKINKNELLEVLNIKNDTRFEEIRDNALLGKKDKVNKLFAETELLSEDSFFYLNNLSARILKLIEIQETNEIYKNYEKTIENIKPPIFWKDKPVYLRQVNEWNLKNLNIAAYKISGTELLMKKNSQIKNHILVKNLIVELSNKFSNFS
ncbi:hypothetical protein OAB59_02640 [Pelagibacteraceae bacterium]|nr:hypothetical protein [Pelagibacteraceae bacterium]